MASPIIKWVGGKWRVMPALDPLLPPANEIDHFAEAFLGGAAMMFHIEQRWPEGKKKLFRLYGNDTNEQLVSFYSTLTDYADEVAAAACRLAAQHNSVTYAQARKLFNDLKPFVQDRVRLSPEMRIVQASLFLYLNKCGFNGLYRENARGEFNVSCNKESRWRPKVDDLQAELQDAARALVFASFSARKFDVFLDDQFEMAEAIIEPGHVFYFLDPPYLNDEHDGFTDYNSSDWSVADLMQLAVYARRIHDSGGKFMLTHVANDMVSDLFNHRDFNTTDILTRTSVSQTAEGRGVKREFVVRNYR